MSGLQFFEDKAATLVLYVPAAHGVPSGSASLTIYASGQSELATGGSWPETVSLDAAAATLDAAASAGDESLSVGSGEATTFTAGRTVLATSTRGEILELRVKGRDTSTDTLYLDQPLAHALQSGSTLAGHRYAFALSTTHTQTRRRRVRAVWTYTAGGEARTVVQRFDVVREPFTFDLSESDIETHDPEFGEYAGHSGRWRRHIEGALRDLVSALTARDLDPDLLRDRDIAKDALIYRVLAKFYRKVDPEASKGFQEDYETKLKEISESSAIWYDADGDDVVADGADARAADASGAYGVGSGGTRYDADGNALSPVGYGHGGRYGRHLGGGSRSELGTPASYAKVG